MRLSCPNCGATYELPDERLPKGGGHVQCAECQTRWFARPPAIAAPPAASRPSEDEIIARLEARSVAPRPLPAGGGETIAFPGPRRTATPPADPAGPAEAAPQAIETEEARSAPASAAPLASARPEAAAPEPARPAATPLRPRPDRPAPAPSPAAARPRRRGGALGLSLALGLAAAGLALYLGTESLAARAPAAAPALRAYAAGIDAAREWIETAVGPLRGA